MLADEMDEDTGLAAAGTSHRQQRSLVITQRPALSIVKTDKKTHSKLSAMSCQNIAG
jgi:hypothetical protein